MQQNSPPSSDLQSTPMVLNTKQTRLGLDMFSPIIPIPEHAQNLFENEKEEASSCIDGSSSVYSLRDVSSWVGGKPCTTQNQVTSRKSPVIAMHNDLDEALAKLQQILANNFTLDGK